jgi:urea carboxylase
MQTTVQDYPGRSGFWHVGVPPSGPMDPLAFRLVNRLVGNDDTAAGLECTMTGPRLRFFSRRGDRARRRRHDAKVDGVPVERWRAITVKAGSELRLGAAAGEGARAYIAVRGGLDVPAYLGSRATFILGKFGGHAGRVSADGRHAPLARRGRVPARYPTGSRRADAVLRQRVGDRRALWTARRARLLHRERHLTLFAASWKVHYNSDRTGCG